MTAYVRQFVEIPNSATSSPVRSIFGTFPQATLPGSTIAVFSCYSHFLTTPATCSDSINGQYPQLNSVADATVSGNIWFCSFASVNANSLTTSTSVSFNLTAPTYYVGMIMFEISGVAALLDHSGIIQTGITGTSLNNINSGSMAAPGSVFMLASSAMTTENGSAPYYPNPGSGYTLGGHWFQDTALSGNALATWEYASLTNPGITTAAFNSPSGSTGDSFITLGMAFSVAVPLMVPVAWFV